MNCLFFKVRLQNYAKIVGVFHQGGAHWTAVVRLLIVLIILEQIDSNYQTVDYNVFYASSIIP